MLGNIQRQKLNENLVKSRASNFDMSAAKKEMEKKNPDKEFNFDEYAEKNHLDSIEEVGQYAKDHHLYLRNL